MRCRIRSCVRYFWEIVRHNRFLGVSDVMQKSLLGDNSVRGCFCFPLTRKKSITTDIELKLNDSFLIPLEIEPMEGKLFSEVISMFFQLYSAVLIRYV